MGGARNRRPRALAAIGLTLLLASPGTAQVPSRCVKGSIGPGGCDSIRPLDADPGPLGIDLPPELAPRPDPLADRPAGPAIAPLRMPGLVLRIGPAPALRDPAMGRDPRAVQSFQTPYVFDGRALMR